MNVPMRTVYIAGPMRGHAQFNFPAFDEAAERAHKLGWIVISPADMDRALGFDPSNGLDGFDMDAAFDRDVAALRGLDPKRGDAIAMLPGWEKSVGASAEHSIARWRGLLILDAQTFAPLYGPEHGQFKIGTVHATNLFTPHGQASIVDGEVRQKDAETGGEKAAKAESFALLPAEPLEDIARVYAYGAKKYSEHNWRKGYPWSWSFSALMRHLWAFWRGEDLDAESGLPHLSHAGFHVLTLLWFRRYRPAKDDRYKLEVAA
jgi:hypothetical protein